MSAEKVRLEIEQTDALTLFGLLSRLVDDEAGGLISQVASHSGEQGVLFALLAKLEATLTEPLRPDYPQLLEEARLDCKIRYG